ncbi:MAG: hypothetical protein GC150_10040 [Rhizobiales bacterium]|nr:hypothetical protein [Hyphomicrobiales bacterium]
MSLKAIPLLILSLIIYNAVILIGAPAANPATGLTDADLTPAYQVLQSEIFRIGMPSGGYWIFNTGDLILMISLILLGIEVIKSTYTRGAGLADQALSTVLFVIFIIQFLLDDNAATSTFFMLTLMALIDVVAGSIIGIRTARRDIGFGVGDA